MPGHPRLYRRGTAYYHRAAIPVDIADTYPKTEETFSLKTKDHREALKLVRIAAVEVDQRFDEHRRRVQQHATTQALKELTDLQVKQLGRLYYAALLAQDEEIRLNGLGDEPKETLILEGMGQDEINKLVDERLRRKDTLEDRGSDRQWLDEELRKDYARGKIGTFFMDEAREVLSWDSVNLRLEPKSPSWRKLARELQAVTIRTYEVLNKRDEGEPVETPAVMPGPTALSSGPILSQALREWIAEKSRTSWVEKTRHEHEVWTAHFMEMAEDKPLSAYSKADGRAFKAMLMKLPANWNKYDALKTLPIDQAAERAAELGIASMSDRNLNKLLGFVGSFWRWAEQHYDECPPNPLRGLGVTIKRLAREERDPFAIDELKAMFSAPLYTGCHSVRRWKQPGDLVPRDAGIFWV